MFELGRKQVFINDLSKFSLGFINKDTPSSPETFISSFADQAAISACEIMNLGGYAKINKTKIRSINATRGIAAGKQANLLRQEHAGGSAAFTPGTTVAVKLKFLSNNMEREFQEWSQTYGKTKAFNITLNTATAALQSKEFVNKLAKNILQEDEYKGGYAPLLDFELGTYDETTFAWVSLGKPTLANLSTFTTADAILLKSVSGTLTYQVYINVPATATAKITLINTYAAVAAAGVSPVVVAGFEGRNTIEQLRRLKLQTDNNVFPYSNQLDDMPLTGSIYSVFTFDQIVERTDLAGMSVVGQPVTSRTWFSIFVNESLQVTIGSVTDYLADIIGIWLSSAASLDFEVYEGIISAGAVVKSSSSWDTANIRIS